MMYWPEKKRKRKKMHRLPLPVVREPCGQIAAQPFLTQLAQGKTLLHLSLRRLHSAQDSAMPRRLLRSIVSLSGLSVVTCLPSLSLVRPLSLPLLRG